MLVLTRPVAVAMLTVMVATRCATGLALLADDKFDQSMFQEAGLPAGISSIHDATSYLEALGDEPSA